MNKQKLITEIVRQIINEIGFTIPVVLTTEKSLFSDEEYKQMNIFEIWTDASSKIINIMFNEYVFDIVKNYINVINYLIDLFSKELNKLNKIVKTERMGEDHIKFYFNRPLPKEQMKRALKVVREEASRGPHKSLLSDMKFPWEKEFIKEYSNF